MVQFQFECSKALKPPFSFWSWVVRILFYHYCYWTSGVIRMGRVNLLIQNWFYKKSKGRQCKGRRPRNFDFFSPLTAA